MENYESLKETLHWLQEEKNRLEKEITYYMELLEEKRKEISELLEESESIFNMHMKGAYKGFVKNTKKNAIELVVKLAKVECQNDINSKLIEVASDKCDIKVLSQKLYENGQISLVERSFSENPEFFDFETMNTLLKVILSLEEERINPILQVPMLNDILATNDLAFIVQFIKNNIKYFSDDNINVLVAKVIESYNPVYIYLVAINLIEFDDVIKKMISALNSFNNKTLLNNLLITLFNKKISGELRSWISNLNISFDASVLFNYDNEFNPKLESAFLMQDEKTINELVNPSTKNSLNKLEHKQ